MSQNSPLLPNSSLPQHSSQSIVLDETRIEALGSRLADWLSISKPRIAVMVLITVTVGYTLAPRENWDWAVLLWTWAGVALVSTASSALNQWLEQETDSRMRRTRNRPLPAGRMSPWEALGVGLLMGSAGCTMLVAMVNIQTAILTAATWALYVGVYTPLKRVSPICTAVGAIPGALPPVIGWAAAGANLDLASFSLFAILFLWQFPHFMAIAWKYRDEYLLAGLKMLPMGLPKPHVTGLIATAYATILIPISLLPVVAGVGGMTYFVLAIVLGLGYLAASIAFAWHERPATARRLILVSIVYLPLVLLALVGDHLGLLSMSSFAIN